MDSSGNEPGDGTNSVGTAAPMTNTESSISDNIIASIVKEQQYQEINARVADLQKRLESEQKARSELQAKYDEERECSLNTWRYHAFQFDLRLFSF
jgi:hypothetical protein